MHRYGLTGKNQMTAMSRALSKAEPPPSPVPAPSPIPLNEFPNCHIWDVNIVQAITPASASTAIRIRINCFIEVSSPLHSRLLQNCLSRSDWLRHETPPTQNRRAAD